MESDPTAQLMEEELQHSVMLTEGDIQEGGTVHPEIAQTENDSAFATNGRIAMASDSAPSKSGGVESDGEESDAEMEDAEEHISDDEEENHEDEDEDEEEDDDDEEEEASDGEEAKVRRATVRTRNSVMEDQEMMDDEEEEEDDEGVGAVKIKPGDTDEEEESDDDASSASEAESTDWDEAGGVEEEEEESENEPSTTCMFCKRDEEHDPGEEFEPFLTCASCGEHAHQQCARDEKALIPAQVRNWRCPDCAAQSGDDSSDENEDAGLSAILDAESPPAARRASAPKLARDLLPAPTGGTKPDSHSVFNQLVVDDDAMDGTRTLRKRKTSSVEADENLHTFRRRRRNTSDLGHEKPHDTTDTSRPQSARSLRLRTPASQARIEKSTRSSLIVQLKVPGAALARILSQRPKGRKRRTRKASARALRAEGVRAGRDAAVNMTAPFVTSTYIQPFYSFFDKETDESKGKPYGGILTEAEADTSRTMPTSDDRRRFDEAKQQAEEEWRQRLLTMQAESQPPIKKSRKASGPASQIECIEFGGWEIDTWYAAPYPEEYSRNRVLYICEFCLKYMNSDYVAWRHKLKCPAKHPPGDEIYRQASVSVFEVDGRKNPVYCQNLCLLAKLFLGSKTLYYDVEPFLFYVLCEYDEHGYHFVGYFSKEKRASSQNNVSCILTLPIHQRKGYGNLLIDFSYLLTRVEKKTGSPEKPLSDMGLVSYRNYWRLVMCQYLLGRIEDEQGQRPGMSIKQISDDTGLTADDVISALEGLRCLVRDPQTQLYAFRVDVAYCREYVAKWESKNYVRLNPKALTWTPYIMGRTNATNFELGPALTAIAPREDDEEHKTAVVAGEKLEEEDGALPPPQTNGVAEGTSDYKMDIDTTVLESTEPNETEPEPHPDRAPEPGETRLAHEVNGVPVQDEEAKKEGHLEPSEPQEEKEEKGNWRAAYKDIPPTRFEVFPPASKRSDRPRATIPRPPAVRIASSSRPKPRRTSSSRRASAPKPKSGSKRKSGGTGRGPGRWPKGTKKSDYGNADSGPGFPPGWRERVTEPGMEVEVPKAEGEPHNDDTVQVSTPLREQVPRVNQ